MKTQKIVLALALVAVTPAVLAAQDYVGGPGSKMLYIADNALSRIRESTKEQNDKNEPQKQEPVQKKQNDTTVNYATVPAYYPYGGREGHMLVQEDVHKKKNNKHHRDTTDRKNNTRTHERTDTATRRTSSTYTYTGIEGHRAALGNAVRDAKRDSTPVPTHVKDLDTVSKSHQVTLDKKTENKNTKQTHKTFRSYLNEIGNAVIQEIPYMK
ncbi:MAG: hypothetical protein J5594_01800 [Elusimicrobiaceae bacterium]|nr:hypothetical protein [Elusimicrobiaceae bacterium]